MEFTDQFVFVIGLLLTLSIVASVPADRSGIPLLVFFLAIGMLAGENGPGGIAFSNTAVAHLLGTTALAVILFDGGLHTPLSSFRTGFAPGVTLATVGVLITAGLTAAGVIAMFDASWPQALLLAAIVSSTDAAAVFYLLRARGLELHHRVRNTLEIESGLNDPMALFLTLVLIEWQLQPEHAGAAELVLTFLQHMGAGALIGVLGGFALSVLLGRLRLAVSLYPLLALSGGLLIYGAAALVDGSGFLAAYVAGLIVGNRIRVARRGIQRFHDGMAWLSQIGLFLMLGLLVTPSELLERVPKALAVAAVLFFIARPAAVALCLLPLRFSWGQIVFTSWMGLRGAVPIVLSLFPLVAGVERAYGDFNVVFFVVVLSLMLQGWTVAPLSRWLGLELPRRQPDAQWIDVEAPADHELVVCELPPRSPAVSSSIEQLRPPANVSLLSVVREGRAVAKGAREPLAAGDLIYLLVPTSDPAVQERLEHWLNTMGTDLTDREQAFFGEFTVDAGAPMSAFAATYLSEAVTDVKADDSVGVYLRRRLRHSPSEGDQLRLNGVTLVVREMEGEQISQVGVRLPRERR